jgi:adhesin HecA-like repeat protein
LGITDDQNNRRDLVHSHHRLIAALGLVAACTLGQFASAATLNISPITETVTAGSQFTIDVNTSGISDLYAYQFDVSFDPTILNAVSSMEGSFLSLGGATFFIPGTVDNSSGVVSATANTLISAVPGVSGSGSLGEFVFQAISSGVSSISVAGVQLLDSAFNSIDAPATGGSITVSSGGGTFAAPEIDPASAVSALTLLLGGLAVLRDRRPKESASRESHQFS